MWKDLKFVKDVSFLNLIAESNISNVVVALNVHQQFCTYVCSIIQDYINFNVCLHSLDFLRNRCKANQIAHYLTKYGLYICIKETPSCIYGVLTFDLLSDFL